MFILSAQIILFHEHNSKFNILQNTTWSDSACVYKQGHVGEYARAFLNIWNDLKY